ncbi:unnamed protein product, partial [Urochloa humidicola]
TLCIKRAATEDAKAGASGNGCDGERWLARMRRSGMVNLKGMALNVASRRIYIQSELGPFKE